MLTDLDDNECAPKYRFEIVPEKMNKNLIFQIAVREVETWLIADKSNFASYIGISKDLMKDEPELVSDPKDHPV